MAATRRLTTAQAVVAFLAQQHTTVAGERRRLVPATLGIFGHGNMAGLGQALVQYGDVMPYVQGRNEQSLVHMAVGYAKEMKRTATLAVAASIGPGSTNMMTGAALATVNRLPVLLLPADAYATRRQGPVLQQLEHGIERDASVNDGFRPLSRFFDRVQRPEQILDSLPEACRVLTNPVETGAVVVSLPQDLQSEAYDFPQAFFQEREWPIEPVTPNDESLSRVVEALRTSRRPMLVLGGGAFYSEAGAAALEVARRYGVALAETFAGRGAVQIDDVCHLGGLGVAGTQAANRAAAEADLIVAVGTRLADFVTASRSLFQDPAVRFVGININDRDAAKMGAVRVVGDARLSLEFIAKSAPGELSAEKRAWLSRVEELKQAWTVERARYVSLEPEVSADCEALTQGQVVACLQEQASDGDVLVVAAGGPPDDIYKTWDATQGRWVHIEFGFSCMGYEIPAALGVRIAGPRGRVVALVGDGTFLMQPSDIVTAVQENLDVTIVIEENGGFQAIRRLQDAKVGSGAINEFRTRAGDGLGGTLTGPYLDIDYVAISRGMGAHAAKVNTVPALLDALAEARVTRGPSVIVVAVDPHSEMPAPAVWWDVAPAEVSPNEAIGERRRQYEEGRAAQQRWYG